MSASFKLAQLLVATGFLWVASLQVFALPQSNTPQLVTPQLPPAILGQPYAASLLIGSRAPLTSLTISGVPAGLTATHNGTGSIAISGVPAAAGSFVVAVVAGNTPAGYLGQSPLNAQINLTVYQVATNVTSVSAGSNHSCALANGGVQCWGYNDLGQLGNNSTTQSLMPVPTIPAGSNVTSISTSGDHACAVASGGVRCWGRTGISGPGIIPPQLPPAPLGDLVPTLVIVPGSDVTSVSAGAFHGCAVVKGGVQCWGGNNFGQLGNNSNFQSEKPVVAIASGSGVTAVSAGNGFACALVNGGVQCWGAAGTLGNNSNIQSLVPVQAIAAGSGVTSISTGSDHSCAVVNGGVQCWGSNASGQLGNNDTARRLAPVESIAAGSNVTSVSAGNAHSCAVVNGGVQCWGNNDYEQHGGTRFIASLGPLQLLPSGSGVTSVTTGGNHTCVVVSGSVRCWGNNSSGQLGNGTTSRSPVPMQAVATGSNVTSASGGFSHSCVVLDGGVQCWGNNNEGELGNNSATRSLSPVQTIAVGSSVAAVSTGLLHSCAVVSGGVQCWGYNNEGQLGNNSTTQSLTPVQTIVAGSNVTAVSAGGRHTCAVVSGGVQCWGSNSEGQLGNNSTTQNLIPVQAIAPGSNVTAVSAGFRQSCAVVNGGVQCWGDNSDGQLGNNGTTRSLVPVQTIAPGSGATAVVTSLAHGCAVVNGGVRCWGNSYLGNGLGLPSRAPVQSIAAQSGVTAVVAGSGHSCALVGSGVQCWGSNGSGQLGINYVGEVAYAPIQTISGLGNVTALSSGYRHSCAVVSSGVACWGLNEYGQLGDTFLGDARRPVTALVLASPSTGLPILLSSNAELARYGDEVILIATVGGNGQTGTVAFSINSGNGSLVLPGCHAVPLVAGVARCAVPAAYQVQSPGVYLAVYSGDAFNAPASTNFSQLVDLNSAVLSMSAFPLAPLVVGRPTTLTALVKMRNPAGSVTFFEYDAPISGCTQVAVSILSNATDAATATCAVTPRGPAGGIPPFKATYSYPVGHVSGRAFQFALLFNILVAQGPPDYTDMWWAGPSENGWGMSVTQHGTIQFNVIFAYDNLGKSLWYVMPGGSFNAAGTVFTGQLYLPTSSPFSAYNKTKFAIGASVGSAAITYTSNGTATLAYTINGVSATKSLQRQIFAAETTGPNLRVNDLWWATSAEDGWGINIAQQGRELFPVWYTYDASGKATFFTAQGGSWSGTVWSGTIFSHASSAWLGVSYNPAAFAATNVGTISLDFTDASSATMTTMVNGIIQVRHIERQPY